MATATLSARSPEHNTPGKRRSPLKAIRAFCMECQGDPNHAIYVEQCKDTACPVYAYRLGEALGDGQGKVLTAIKAYCFDNCQAGAGREEVLSCQGDKAIHDPCAFFPFRLGKNPNQTNKVSKEIQAMLIEAGKKNRFLPGVNGLSSTLESPEPTLTIVDPGREENSAKLRAETCLNQGVNS